MEFDFQHCNKTYHFARNEQNILFIQEKDGLGKWVNLLHVHGSLEADCIRALLTALSARDQRIAELEHVARLNDEIVNLTAKCNTLKEELEASEQSRHNLRLFANNETYFDLPMSGPDIDTRNRLFELRAEAERLRGELAKAREEKK